MTLESRVTALAQAMGGDVKGLSLAIGPPAAVQALMSGGAALHAWLATPANLTAFQTLLGSLLGPAALSYNTAAMQAVVVSSTAMNAVIGNQAVLNALATGACAGVFRASTVLVSDEVSLASNFYPAGGYLPLSFSVPVHVHSMDFHVESPARWQLEWSDNGVSWTAGMSGQADWEAATTPIALAGRHRYWRMYIPDGAMLTSFRLAGWR